MPRTVFVVGIAGDLEILSRTCGLRSAWALLRTKSSMQYPSPLVDVAIARSCEWLKELERTSYGKLQGALLTHRMAHTTAPELIAHVADLKMPWMTGFS